MVGLFEGEGAAWNVNRVPNDFSFGEIEPDWDRLAPYLEVLLSGLEFLANFNTPIDSM